MSYNEVIKEMESIGLEIDYTTIDVQDLNEKCTDEESFRIQLHPEN